MKKINILIISDSYFARTIIFNLDYVINIQINKVYLLEENHLIDEEYYGIPFQLISKKNLAQCINYCDIVFVYGHEKMYPLLDTDLLQQKRIIRFPILSCEFLSEKKLDIKNIKLEVPVILNIVVGDYTSQYCAEILLNKVVGKYLNNFKQIYSNQTYSIINTLKDNNLLSSQFNLYTIQNFYDLFVCTLCLKSLLDLQKNRQFIRLFEQLSPNYVILTTSFDKVVSDEALDNLKSLFWYRYNTKLNLIILSNFFESPNKKFAIYYAKANLLPNIQNDCNFYNKNIETILENDLITNLAYPDDIHII
ncbi:MAG: hypothetical protein IKT70_08665 [Clostridia bacterium]|nr:hypothetical protein [Clostridia bacterium]